MRDWEACYRNNETPWDKGTAAPPLEELVDEYGSVVFLGGQVLVPGCGLGHDVRDGNRHRVPPLGERPRHVVRDYTRADDAIADFSHAESDVAGGGELATVRVF